MKLRGGGGRGGGGRGGRGRGGELNIKLFVLINKIY